MSYTVTASGEGHWTVLNGCIGVLEFDSEHVALRVADKFNASASEYENLIADLMSKLEVFRVRELKYAERYRRLRDAMDGWIGVDEV